MFDGYDGFVPLSLYPGFSADFFDTLHNVVVSDIPLCLHLFFSFLFAHVLMESVGRLAGPT